MIKFLLGLLLLASPVVAVSPMSVPQYGCIVAATNNIPTSYSITDGGSLIISLAAGTVATHFAVTKNTLGAPMAISVSSNSTQVAPVSNSSNTNQILIDSNVLAAFDDMRISNRVLVHSTSGAALTTGLFCIVVW